MEKISQRFVFVLTILLCCVAGAAQEHPAYDYHLNAEHVVDFDSLDVTLGNISLQLGKGSLLPMDTSRGFVGAVVVAPGQVKFKTDESKEVFEDEIDSAMLRFNPADYNTILKLGDLKPHRDTAFQKQASSVLRKYFLVCYHEEDKAIIPDRENMAVVFDGKHYDKTIVIHYYDRKNLIFPGMNELGLIKGLATFQADDKLNRDQKWEKDIQHFATALPAYHPNVFFRLSKDQFRQQVDSLLRAVPKMSDMQIFLGLSKITAKIGDAHTKVDLSNMPISMYPMWVYWFKDGLFVTGSSQDYERTIGTRLVKIGGTDVDEIYRAVGEIIPHENPSWLKNESPLRMMVPEILTGLGVISMQQANLLTFRTQKGREFTIEVEPVPVLELGKHKWVSHRDRKDSELPVSLQPRGGLYWYEYLEDSHTLYFQYKLCRMMKNKPIDEFGRELLEFIKSHPVEKFIFDIRDNSGGSSPLIEPLIEDLKNSKVNKKGRLFCVVGRKTFSSAILNALKLRRDTHAIFVGEPTGGKPNHFGHVETFALPYSKLRIRYSTKHFHYLKEDSPSLMPDILVEVSSSDFFSDKDPVLQAILEYRQ